MQPIVTNARGQPLKPLPRGTGRGGGKQQQQGRMPFSTSGVHLELSEGAMAALAAAMPLAPGATVAVAVDLNVGRPPLGDRLEEVALDVCLSYVGDVTPPPVASPLIPPASDAAPDGGKFAAVSSASLSAPGKDDRPAARVGDGPCASLPLGRRLSLPVHFRIMPTVQVRARD
jgi:hypothetical protein